MPRTFAYTCVRTDERLATFRPLNVATALTCPILYTGWMLSDPAMDHGIFSSAI